VPQKKTSEHIGEAAGRCVSARGKCALAFGAFVLAFAVSELALRIMSPDIRWVPRKDPLLGWSTCEYRQFDAPPPSDDGPKRILFLGDSFLAGWGVSDADQRFPMVWGRDFQKEVDVGIFASAGWGTDQQMLAFLAKGKLWRPDAVVVVFCANNDISNILSHHHGPGMLKPYFVLRQDGELHLHDPFGGSIALDEWGTRAQAFRSGGATGSYLVDMLVGRIRKVFSADIDDSVSFAGVDSRYRRFRYWKERLDEIRECRAHVR